ncbi:MAG: IS21-like element helper ATPase IstB [candidate division NC10 bacterium]
MRAAPREGLEMKLRSLKLPSFVAHHGEVAGRAETGGWRFDRFLDELAGLELEERTRRRIERLLKASHLPADKTLATLDLARLPPAVKRQVPTLCDGGFIERTENVLAFGLPGRGKTHLLSAIGHELVQRGYRVLFIAAFRLVQHLLAAKRELKLDAELRRLDAVDALIVDDIGYIQQDREEMEVLFTLLAERYERRSVLISSNLVFSQWDRIFKDPMTTACAIDRVVHHATILELVGSSYRSEAAKKRTDGRGDEGGAKAAKEVEA